MHALEDKMDQKSGMIRARNSVNLDFKFQLFSEVFCKYIFDLSSLILTNVKPHTILGVKKTEQKLKLQLTFNTKDQAKRLEYKALKKTHLF